MPHESFFCVRSFEITSHAKTVGQEWQVIPLRYVITEQELTTTLLKRKPNQKLAYNRFKLNRRSIRPKVRKMSFIVVIFYRLGQFLKVASLIQLNSCINFWIVTF